MKQIAFIIAMISLGMNVQAQAPATYWLDTTETKVYTGILPGESTGSMVEALGYSFKDTTGQFVPRSPNWICVGTYYPNIEVSTMNKYTRQWVANTKQRFTGPKPVHASHK